MSRFEAGEKVTVVGASLSNPTCDEPCEVLSRRVIATATGDRDVYMVAIPARRGFIEYAVFGDDLRRVGVTS